MAYVLLAIGALMSVVGAYAIITGAHIVQVEAGWTSVIAGSVLFVGGFIMMGLGLVLRTLVKVQATFAGVARAVPMADAVPVLPGTSKLPGASPALPASPAKIEPQVEDQLRPNRPPRPPVLPLVPPISMPAQTMPAQSMPPQSMPLQSMPGAPVGPPPPPTGLARPKVDVAETTAFEPAAPEELVFEPVVPEVASPRPSDDYKLETPSTSEHDLVAADPAPRPEEDWLDRAFAEFDQELPKPPPPAISDPPRVEIAKSVAPKLPRINPAGPALAPEPDAGPALEPAFADAEPEVAATVASASEPILGPAAPPPATGPAASVIGRYESDGTSYVMYADGSIEAQSATGVYRFASMAELKAFIES